MSDVPMVELVGVTKRFGDVVAVDSVDLTVAKAEVVCVVGPSGSGKSTLVRLVNALERADGGTVLVEGEEVHADKKDVNRHRRRTALMHPKPRPRRTARGPPPRGSGRSRRWIPRR